MKKLLVLLGILFIGYLGFLSFFRTKMPIKVSNNPNTVICTDTFWVEKDVFGYNKIGELIRLKIDTIPVVEKYYCNQILVNFENLSNSERLKVRRDTLEKKMGLKLLKQCPCSDIEVWGTEGNIKIDGEDRNKARSSKIAQNSGGTGKNLISSLNLILSVPNVTFPSSGDPSMTIVTKSNTGKATRVALLDSGIDDRWNNNNIELKNYRWNNPKENIHPIFKFWRKDCFPDDLYGYDFVKDEAINLTNHIVDNNGHGTHIAGIIAGSSISKLVDANIQIMDVKILDNTKNGDLFNYICGLDYARQNGAKIFNSSIGAYTRFEPQTLTQVLDKIDKGEGLVIASAGNDGLNNDRLISINAPNIQLLHIPSDINNDAIISVAALNTEKEIFWIGKDGKTGTNYGPISIDVAAPGELIASSYLDYKTQELTGTSMATGQISRIAAILDNGTNSSNNKLKNCIIQHANAGSNANLGRTNIMKIKTKFGILEAVPSDIIQNCLPPTGQTNSSGNQ